MFQGSFLKASHWPDTLQALLAMKLSARDTPPTIPPVSVMTLVGFLLLLVEGNERQMADMLSEELQGA